MSSILKIVESLVDQNLFEKVQKEIFENIEDPVEDIVTETMVFASKPSKTKLTNPVIDKRMLKAEEYLEVLANHVANLSNLINVKDGGGFNKQTVLDIGANGRHKYVDYNDTSTGITALILEPDVWVTIPNDGAGEHSKSKLPKGVTSLMDLSTGKLDISELPLDSGIFIRNDFTVIPSANNSIVAFRYVLGTGLKEYTLETSLGRLDSGAGIEYRRSLRVDYIYVGDENTRNNPIVLQIKLSSAGTLLNSGSAIAVEVS